MNSVDCGASLDRVLVRQPTVNARYRPLADCRGMIDHRRLCSEYGQWLLSDELRHPANSGHWRRSSIPDVRSARAPESRHRIDAINFSRLSGSCAAIPDTGSFWVSFCLRANSGPSNDSSRPDVQLLRSPSSGHWHIRAISGRTAALFCWRRRRSGKRPSRWQFNLSGQPSITFLLLLLEKWCAKNVDKECLNITLRITRTIPARIK